MDINILINLNDRLPIKTHNSSLQKTTLQTKHDKGYLMIVT